MATITLCSSASFYRQVIDIQVLLQQAGFTALIPSSADKMKESGDFDVSHYKTWFGDAKDYPKKTALMRGHFDKIAQSDAILVVNNEKHSQANYIGGNVLMEMAVAFYLKKPIFILNEMPKDSIFLEEIIGLGPIVLHGKPELLTSDYDKLIAEQAQSD